MCPPPAVAVDANPCLSAARPPAAQRSWKASTCTRCAVEPVDEEEAEIDLFGESTRGNLHFADSSDDEEAGRLPPTRCRRRIDDVLGLHNAEDILSMPWEELRSRTQTLLGELGVPVRSALLASISVGESGSAAHGPPCSQPVAPGLLPPCPWMLDCRGSLKSWPTLPSALPCSQARTRPRSRSARSSPTARSTCAASRCAACARPATAQLVAHAAPGCAAGNLCGAFQGAFHWPPLSRPQLASAPAAAAAAAGNWM